jgi:hypothetical protein
MFSHAGSDAEEFSDDTPIGQIDEHGITRSVVEVCTGFIKLLHFHFASS